MRVCRPLALLVSAAVSLSTVQVLAAPASADTSASTAASTGTSASAGSTESGPVSRPDVPSAQAAARILHTRVLVESETTEDSLTYVNADGTFHAELTAAPVRVQRAGRWVNIDPTLIAGADGVRPRAAKGDLRLAGGTTSGTTAGTAAGTAGSSSDGSELLSLTPGSRRSLAVRWPGSLPKPTLEGRTATYAEVAPGVDLTVSALRDGYEDSVVLKSRSSAGVKTPIWRFPLKATGLTARQDSSTGVITFVDNAGKTLAFTAPARMFDAQRDPATGDPSHTGAVTTTLVTGKSGQQEIQLTPQASFLTDPATVFPVTIDPSTHVGEVNDSWVAQRTDGTDYWTSTSPTEMRAGYSTGNGTTVLSAKHRAFIKFNLSGLAGQYITSAQLGLYQWNSIPTCNTSGTAIYPLLGAFDDTTKWPGPGVGSYTAVRTTNCAQNAWYYYDLRQLTDDWTHNRLPNNGVAVRAANETQTQSFWRFYGGQYTGAQLPSLAVDYNRPPSTPSSLTPINGAVFKRTPTLSAAVSDVDGQNVALAVTVRSASGNVAVDNQVGSFVSSGSRASVTIPQVVDGTYTWTAQAFDGTDYSPPSAAVSFTVNSRAVGPASISSSAYPQNGWNPAGGPGTFQLTSPVDSTQDADRFMYWFDSAPTQQVMATVTGGQAVANVTVTPPPGWHTLRAYAMDAGGATSNTTTSYAFGAKPAMAAPTNGAQVTGTIALQATGPAATLKYQYRLSGGTFADVPLADVTDDAGNPLSAWQSTAGGAAPTIALRWNIDATLAAAGANVAVDNGVAVDVQAVFGTAGSWDSATPTTLTYTPSAVAPSHATDDIGPGTVDLLTGNFAVSDTDADVTTYGDSVQVGRTFNSRQPTATGPWGPGWISSLVGDASDYTSLRNTGGSVSILTADGTQLTFAKTATGSYRPVADAATAQLSLTKNTAPAGDWRAPDYFELRDPDGTTVTFTSTDPRITPTLAAPQRYLVGQVQTPGQNNQTQYLYSNGQLTQVTPPTVGNSPCTGSTPGATWTNSCRVLLLTYSGGRVSQIALKAYDATRTSSGGSVGLVTIPVACYSYDSNGRLAQVWDPRITSATPDCATGSAGAAPTSYTYDSAGRLATVTEGALAPHQLTYDSKGKLLTASRAHNASNGGGTETETVTYNAGVNIGGQLLAGTDDSRPDLSAASTARWAQTASPVTATAIYGPGDTVGDLRDATIHALDANGRELNTAVFSGTGQNGWKITTSEYSSDGLPVRTLTAANRELALDPAAGDINLQLPTDTPSRARALDTTNLYATGTDGLADLVASYGPLHMVTLDDGSYRAAREHTQTIYGNEPAIPGAGSAALTTDGPSHQVKTVTVSASLNQTASSGNDRDSRTTENFYALSSTGSGDNEGWTLKTPVKTVTSVPQATDIARITRYDTTTGQVTKTQMPNDPTGSTAGTTVSRYYSPGTRSDSSCVNDAWVGQLCSTSAAAAPTSGHYLPDTRTDYDYALRPVAVTQSVTNSGSYNRVTSTTYQQGGISPRVDRTATTGGEGIALPATVTHYDSNGLVDYTEYADSTGRVSTGYDDFGRVTSSTDADADTTSTSYDNRGRVATVSNSKQTLTYGYDSSTEHRGLVTSLLATAVSTTTPFVGSYNADGTLTRQTYPDGLVQTTTVDETGDPRSLTYTRGSTVLISDSQDSSINGQWRHHSGYGSSQTYSYDNAGRLTTVDDTVATTNGNACTRRTYGFDVNSNRKTRASTDCTTGASLGTTTYTYDNADRLQGNSYDPWGRTTTLNNPGATVTARYYNTDLVQQLDDSTTTRSWTLDSTGRRRTMTDTTGPTKTSHYDNSDDNPSWIAEGNSTTTTYTTGLDGNLTAATTTNGNSTQVAYQLTNLHGDTITTATPGASTPGAALDTDEYGNPHHNTATRYGWLGGKQRSNEALGGLTLMGVRLYSPELGRFLSVDPVPGGSDNAYDYAGQDPANNFDLDGRWKRPRFSWRHTPTRWGFFDKRNRHLVMRDGKPGIHWYNDGDVEPNRLEFGKGRGYHFNPSGQKGVHLGVRAGLKALARSGMRGAARSGWRGLKSGARSYRGGGGTVVYIPPFDRPTRNWHW